MSVCELPKWVLGTDWILDFLEDNNCSLTAKPSLQPRKDVFKIMEITVRRDPRIRCLITIKNVSKLRPPATSVS